MCVSMDRLILLLSSTPSLSVDLTGPLFAAIDVYVDGQSHFSVIFDSLPECRFDLLYVCCNRCVSMDRLIFLLSSTSSLSVDLTYSMFAAIDVCRWTGSFFCYLRLPP